MLMVQRETIPQDKWIWTGEQKFSADDDTVFPTFGNCQDCMRAGPLETSARSACGSAPNHEFFLSMVGTHQHRSTY